MKRFFTFLILLNLFSNRIYSDGQSAETAKHEALNPCISERQYEDIIRRCKQNVRILNDGISRKPSDRITTLSIPIAEENYLVTAYVDNDPARGRIADYSCGTLTYDGHTGTDISIWPFGFYDRSINPEIIAAAPGIIIDKDGTSVKSYIVIQHDDGSCAIYWNMAANSLTVKAIGQRIESGEYLGIAGNTPSGPQIHFEVWKSMSNSTFVDPFLHDCKNLQADRMINPDFSEYSLKLE